MRQRILRCFLAVPFHEKNDTLLSMISASASQAKFKTQRLDSRNPTFGMSTQEYAVGEISQCDFILADITNNNPEVYFVLGLAQAMDKGILLISDDSNISNIPFDIASYKVIRYSRFGGNEIFVRSIVEYCENFRKFPRSMSSFKPKFTAPFFVDFEKLSPSDVENMCRELIAQLGFKRINWHHNIPGIDLIAELPKKDPDGYEYSEVWLIGMGMREPQDYLLDRILHKIDYFFTKSNKYGYISNNTNTNNSNQITTILLIDASRRSHRYERELFHERMDNRINEFPSLRLRIWDRTYLTTLVQRFPSIGYKYFSDEGRLRSETRKSYEELYNENSVFAQKQAKLIADLEEEKSKRVSAERDAVWKDISFTAAHKIGNPIFAIETDLNPLRRRITENRTSDAIDVVANIQSAVEKAKAFVEQFKSLARAQEIKLKPTLLKPILEDATHPACNHDINCLITCSDEVTLLGDPERLSECFDELVINATHWLDKDVKKISITVTFPSKEALPDMLDKAEDYAEIHIVDNGCGVSLADKNHIFDAFVTNHDHGTGLGLALVRRIIDGHGGAIFEIGEPGKGADFALFLPLYNMKRRR